MCCHCYLEVVIQILMTNYLFKSNFIALLFTCFENTELVHSCYKLFFWLFMKAPNNTSILSQQKNDNQVLTKLFKSPPRTGFIPKSIFSYLVGWWPVARVCSTLYFNSLQSQWCLCCACIEQRKTVKTRKSDCSNCSFCHVDLIFSSLKKKSNCPLSKKKRERERGGWLRL